MRPRGTRGRGGTRFTVTRDHRSSSLVTGWCLEWHTTGTGGNRRTPRDRGRDKETPRNLISSHRSPRPASFGSLMMGGYEDSFGLHAPSTHHSFRSPRASFIHSEWPYRVAAKGGNGEGRTNDDREFMSFLLTASLIESLITWLLLPSVGSTCF